MTFIGIDVGSKELFVSVLHKKTIKKIKTFSNTTAGHNQIIKLCSKYLRYGKVKIAMESTGVYYFDLAVALTNNNKFDVMSINPRATKNFALASMERNKTDKVDAQLLALFAEKMDYPLWKRPSKDSLNLRYLSRTISILVNDKARAKNNLHALESCLESPEILQLFTQDKIKFLKDQIDALKKEALALIKQDNQLNQWFELLQTIKGFGQTSAIQFLGEITSIPEGLTHKQWVAFAGLDPRQFQSGTSVNKKLGISKAGNRHLRKILFMPALSAARNDIYVKGYYHHLLEDRKLAKLQAIVAIMRKLLHAIHGMFYQLKPFDNTRFYLVPFKG